MTKPKKESECPICSRSFKRLSKHLLEWHGLTNSQERLILNQLANGRIMVGGGPCPFPMCLPNVLWLEKHLRGHKDYSPQRISREIRALKRKVAIECLKALRATKPQQPIISTLDLRNQEEEEEKEEEEPQAGRVGRCQKSACRNARKRVRELEKQLKDLQQSNATLRDAAGEGSSCTQRPAPAPRTGRRPKSVEVIEMISSDADEVKEEESEERAEVALTCWMCQLFVPTGLEMEKSDGNPPLASTSSDLPMAAAGAPSSPPSPSGAPALMTSPRKTSLAKATANIIKRSPLGRQQSSPTGRVTRARVVLINLFS